MLSLVSERINTDWIQTKPVERPQPDKGPISTEYESIEAVPKGMDRWVGFSGGTDSYAIAKFALSKGLAHGVVYCDTGSGLATNLSYVRKVCEKHNWPLLIVPPRHCYEFPALRYGFPGPDFHSIWFNLCKGSGWGKLSSHIDNSLKLFTGVRKHESQTRIRTVTDEVDYETSNFRGWYISPFWDWQDSEIDQYLEAHGLTQNPVYENISRSGDCYCLAYAGRDELLQLAKHYPGHYYYLLNAERRVQEYRGRLSLLEDLFPNMVEYANDVVRKEYSQPWPLMHTVLKDNFPVHYEWAKNLPRKRCILRGMQEHTNYLGHGGESTKELEQAAAQADESQTTICGPSCHAKSVMGVVPSVEQEVEAAEKESKQYKQTTLVA